MGTGRKFNKQPVTRPKKNACDKARRVRSHRERVSAAGYTDEQIKHMTPADLRAAIRQAEKGSAAA
jgi:hypothetical protein